MVKIFCDFKNVQLYFILHYYLYIIILWIYYSASRYAGKGHIQTYFVYGVKRLKNN